LAPSPGQRFAKLLLGWSAQRGGSSHSLQLHLAVTHEEIGEMIGTTRETVTRLFSDFKMKQFIQSTGSHVVILNKSALEGMVEGWNDSIPSWQP
jgi:CRP/FNR family transcriptional regulator